MEPASEESSQDLLKCGETASIFFQKPSVSLDPARFEEFWKKLKPASYASTLMTRLIAVYTGEDKHVQLYDKVKALVSNSLGPVPDVLRQELDSAAYQQQQNVLTTLFFVGTFFPFLISNINLKVSLGRLTNMRNKLTAALPGLPDPLFISELEKIYSQPTTYQSLDGVKYAIQQCIHLDRSKSLDYHRISAKSMAISLLHNLVRNRLYHNQESSNFVFEQLIGMLQHPSVSESLLLPLLHMLRVSLSNTAFPPISLLPRIITAVTPYYIWPRPYSDAAREVIEVASIELKSPGTALRTTMMEETPSLVPGMPSSSLQDSNNASTIPIERNVWVLFDKDMPRARALCEILKQHVPTQTSSTELQLRFLATIFSIVLKMKPEALGLEYATPEQLTLYFGAAVTVLEHSLTLPEERAIEHYTTELSVLQKKILSEIGSAVQHKPPKPMRLPPLNFVTKVAGFSVKDLSIDTNAHTRHRFPKRESYDHLLEILTQASEMVVPGERPPVVKIGIIGGDDSIHNLATGFLVLSTDRPELVEKIDVQFYFIPADNSDLANWFCSLDPWYGRHSITLPRAVAGLYPGPQSDASSPSGSSSSSSAYGQSSTPSGRSQSMRIDPLALSNSFVDLIEEQSKLISPSSILHSELEYMFREAKNPLNLNIFKAECVLPDNSAITLPFFARACLGLPAAIEAFKKVNDLGSNLTEAEITAHKNFKWNPPTVALKYIQMNPLSVARAIGQQDARVYTTITLASLPVPSDAANFINPNPTHPWLELTLLEDKKKKATSREDVRTYHVSQVELSGPEPFDLCLDGISYGFVSRVKFTAATHNDKDLIHRLPFMTYFPTEGLH